MSRYIAAYDISDDQQREKVARVLFGFGDRLQKSVFLIDLEPEDVPELKFAIGKYLSAVDAFEIIPIDDSPGRFHLRWQADLDDLQPVIIV